MADTTIYKCFYACTPNCGNSFNQTWRTKIQADLRYANGATPLRTAYICGYENGIYARARLPVHEKNVVHCASTMAIFNVKIVSKAFTSSKWILLYVCAHDSNSILKYISYNVLTDERERE